MKRILLVALAAVAVVGCKKTDMSSVSDSAQVQFTASTSSLTRTSSSAGSESTSWVEDDRIGIYMDGDDYSYNIEYKVTDIDNDNSATLSVVTEGDELLYPESGTVDFYAYYPYSADLTEGTTDSKRDIYVADLSEQSYPELIDFMVASNTGCSSATGSVALAFEHQLSKMVLNISIDESIFDINDLNQTREVCISGAQNKGDYSYKGGEPDFTNYIDNLEDIELRILTSSEEGTLTALVAEAILHPVEIQYGSLIFKVGTTEYEASIDGFTPEQGMIYTFDIKLSGEGVEFTSSSITPWESGQEVSGTIQAELVGEGTEVSPFYVYDRADLAMIGASDEEYIKDGVGSKGGVWSMTAHYKLMSNIDLEYNEWTPIKLSSGTFDGNDKIISGLKVSISSDESQRPGDFLKGLFGYINSGSVVKNLAVVDCDVAGYYYVGGVVGSCNSSTIQDCYVSGSVTGYCTTSSAAVGGIVGNIEINDEEGSVSTISRCYNLASVSGNSSGGVAGSVTDSQIINCYNIGEITATTGSDYWEFNNCGGGIVGKMYGSNIVACYNTGKITGISSMGGILGSCTSTDKAGSIVGCFSTSDIIKEDESKSSYGAIVGYDCNTGDILTISSCFYMASDDLLGCGYYKGVVSTIDDNSMTQAVTESEMAASGAIVAQKLSSGIATYNEGVTDESLKGYEFTYDANQSAYPTLTTDISTTVYSYGNGTHESLPIQLYFATDFSPRGAASSNSLISDSYYKMMADIDLDGDEDYQWTMMDQLTSTFNGNGHTLSGIYINTTGEAALFKNIKSASKIISLTIEGDITSSDNSAAGFVVYNYGIINGCINKAKITSSNEYSYFPSGIATVCDNNGGTSYIINSYHCGELIGNDKCGITIMQSSNCVQNCYSIGADIINQFSYYEPVVNSYDYIDGVYTYYNSDTGTTVENVEDLLTYLNSNIPTNGWSWEINSQVYPTLISE